VIYKNFMDRRKAQRTLQRELARFLNIRLKRNAEWSFILEDTADGIVIAVLPGRSDRMAYWRLRRLSSE